MNTEDDPPHGPYKPSVHVRFLVKSCYCMRYVLSLENDKEMRTFSSLILVCARFSNLAITEVILSKHQSQVLKVNRRIIHSACNDWLSFSLCSSPPLFRLSLLLLFPPDSRAPEPSRDLELMLDAFPLSAPLPGPELSSLLDTSFTFFIQVISSIFADFPPMFPRLIVPP
jgi:hypothetical protein